jgi:hypothetical protein
MGEPADLIGPYPAVVRAAVAQYIDHGAEASLGLERRKASSNP